METKEIEHPRLENLKENLDDIAGEWNGDLPGLKEERAHAACEAIEKINELEELLTELDLNY